MSIDRTNSSVIGLALFIGIGLGAALTVGCGTTDDPNAADSGQQDDSGSGQPDSGALADGALPDGDQPDAGDLPLDEARSSKQRITQPQVAPDAFDAQVAANNGFALELYQMVRQDPGNLIFSPHSISMAMAMVHGGARAATEQQLGQGMHFVLGQDELHPTFNKLDLELESRGEGSEAADGGAFRLRVVNAAWGQVSYHFLPEYLDLLALHYGAGMNLLDFEQTEAARQTINKWVEQQTESRIKDLLSPGSVSPITRLVLTNAIYFNAAWADPFDDKATADGPFTKLDGSTVSVPMMKGTQQTRYAAGADYEAVELPYDGNELSMLLIVPAAGSFSAFEQSLDSQAADALLAGMDHRSVAITMPKFENKKKLDLNENLAAMGISDLFDPSKADLSGIDGTRKLYVSRVVHQAFIKVNEAGTEAAAATAVVMPPSASPPATLTADRPFIYLIRDHATSAILFVGRVVDPS